MKEQTGIPSPARVREILRERARTLARPPESTTLEQASIELLEFRLAGERYALETRHVREVHPLRNLTPLPCTPSFVLGVVNVRGRILPVLDLKKFFGLPENGLTDLHRVILVGNDDLEIGLLADVGVGVSVIPVESLRPPPTLASASAEYFKGVTAERLMVLEIERILADPRIIVHEEVDV